MGIEDLNKEQLIKAKQMYLTEIREKEGASPSMAELAYIDDIVTDETVKEYYSGISFVEEDFA